MKILKFGGSSVATPEAVGAVTEIVAAASRRGEVAVVVSAFGGVTDALLSAAAAAVTDGEAYREPLAAIEARHRQAAETLTPAAERSAAAAFLDTTLGELRDLLHGVALLREASRRTLDSISSYGERLSAYLVASALRGAGLEAAFCDARRLIVTGPEFGDAQVDLEMTYERVRRHFEGERALQVVTGFIAATPEGETTTLGRGGSDSTAALLGAALEAEAVELWTDVDGVMSADPRQVPAAAPIAELSYDELMELSHFGAKVVYPPSIHPARQRGVPLVIKNTFNPSFPGTRVGGERSSGGTDGGESPLRGISSISRVALLRLEGDGMVGVPGIAMRLFGALAREGVSVILISQASSEHSICFAVTPDAVPAAEHSLEREFYLERRAGLIDPLVVERDLAVVAAVGSGMRERPGIAGRLFGVLGVHGVNVRAIAQGSSERNVSLVVAAGDETRALNAIHDAFFFPGLRPVEIWLAGVGRVGGALLAQLARRRDDLEAETGVRLRLAGLAASRQVLVAPEGLDPSSATERLRGASKASSSGVDGLVDRLLAQRRPRRVFVDCTAGDEAPACYGRLLEAGVAVATANKRGLSGPLAAYRRLLGGRSWRAGRPFFYEATVGAGLPVVSTLEDLMATGDRLLRFDGVLSGTLAFLVDRLHAGVPLSSAVSQAHELGYTEPDPREDLRGTDVGRKLLILARLAGLELEPEEVAVEPFLPGEGGVFEGDLERFWRRLPELDAAFARRVEEAEEAGRRLCYVASLADGRARVALEAVPSEHPCGGVRGSDNLVALTTERYRESPLVVRGPGAGPEVTAAGVFADILRAVAEAPD